MHPVLLKSFGGLTKQYYFRQLFFGLLFLAWFVFMVTRGNHPFPLGLMPFFVISALLYPYSRFVYESIIGFIMGNNLFFVNAVMMMLVKVITMSICFVFAIFIAPIGLGYLYLRNR